MQNHWSELLWSGLYIFYYWIIITIIWVDRHASNIFMFLLPLYILMVSLIFDRIFYMLIITSATTLSRYMCTVYYNSKQQLCHKIYEAYNVQVLDMYAFLIDVVLS